MVRGRAAILGVTLASAIVAGACGGGDDSGGSTSADDVSSSEDASDDVSPAEDASATDAGGGATTPDPSIVESNSDGTLGTESTDDPPAAPTDVDHEGALLVESDFQAMINSDEYPELAAAAPLQRGDEADNAGFTLRSVCGGDPVGGALEGSLLEILGGDPPQVSITSSVSIFAADDVDAAVGAWSDAALNCTSYVGPNGDVFENNSLYRDLMLSYDVIDESDSFVAAVSTPSRTAIVDVLFVRGQVTGELRVVAAPGVNFDVLWIVDLAEAFRDRLDAQLG